MKKVFWLAFGLVSTAMASPADEAMQALLKKAGYAPFYCLARKVPLGDYCASMTTTGKVMQTRMDGAARALGFQRRGPWKQTEGVRSAIFTKGNIRLNVSSLDMRAYGYADALITLEKSE